MKRWNQLICCFLLVLTFFYLSGRWYDQSELVITGTAGLADQFSVQWDSGKGYNEYEREHFSFTDRPSRTADPLPVTIRYLRKQHAASLSRDFVIKHIFVDGAPQQLSSPLSETNIPPNKEDHLNVKHPVVTVNEPVEHSVEIELFTNNYSGIAGIQVGEEHVETDLYIANVEAKSKILKYWFLDDTDHFVVRFKVPRYEINTFKIVHNKTGEQFHIDSINYEERESVTSVAWDTVSNTSFFTLQNIRHYHYWHPAQFGFQVAFSLLTTWVLSALLRQWHRVGGWKGVLQGQRKVFWLFGLGAAGVFTLWLIPFWPGVMSVDSLKIWRAALLPEVFINDHPLFNVILYMYLAQLWPNPAIVPLFHIVMLSLLTAFVFSSLHNRGVPCVWLLPFYFLLLTSLPVGLYNLVLWKDIPFALLIVFWAYTLVDLYQQKKSGNLYISTEKGLVLFLLLLALALTRHNGVVYVPVILFYFFVMGLVNRKAFLLVAVGGFFLLGLCVIGAQYYLDMANANYFLVHAGNYLQGMFAGNAGDTLQRVWNNYWEILNVNQTNSGWDLWHYFLGDRTAYWFLRYAQWNDVYPYILDVGSITQPFKELVMLLYWKSYDAPWVYLTWNPLYILVLMPLTVLFFRRTPNAAIMSSFILAQVGALLFIDIMNWRYYYYVCLGGLFLGPVLMLDIYKWREGNLLTMRNSL